MKTGLLWFDDSERQLEEKVLRAAQRYERKFGRSPTLCFTHRSAFEGNEKRPVKRAGTVEVRPGRSVLRYHFWLGVGDETDRSRYCRREADTSEPRE
ncbi:MAG: hypothetical protein JXD18_13250 [Anaerolineae bacterium]|nr:hypothetical protein [Anaerolineae bacterium]